MTQLENSEISFPVPAVSEDSELRMRVALAEYEYPEACTACTTGEAGDFMLFIPYKDSDDEALKGLKIRVYPNPTDNYLQLDLSTIQTKENLTYRMLNSRGAIVKTSELDGTHKGDFFISLENLTNGIYFLEVLEKGKSLGVQRVVKNSEANRYRF